MSAASRSALLVVLALAGCQATAPDATPALQELVIPPRVPSERAPVLVLVHGYGANERDLASLAPNLDPRFAIHAVRAPIMLAPDAWAWFPVGGTTEADTARKALSRFIGDLRARSGPVYLLGFSQGAMLGLSLAYSEPGLLDGVVAIGGRMLPQTGVAKKGRSPKVLIQHGRQDARVPYEKAPESQQVLETAGRVVELRSYDAGHQISEAMLSDLAQWLTARLNETEAAPGG